MDLRNIVLSGDIVKDDPVVAEHTAAIHAAIGGLRKRTVEVAVEIGSHLLVVKSSIDDGKWLAWIEQEFGFSDQTARRFIHLYESHQRDPALNKLLNEVRSLSAAYLLAAPQTPEAAREEIAEHVRAGRTPSFTEVKKAIAKAAKRGATKSGPAETKPKTENVVGLDAEVAARKRYYAEHEDAVEPHATTSPADIVAVWGRATLEVRQHAVEVIGLEELFPALPRAWLPQLQQLIAEALDLSIPEFLRRDA